MNQQEKRVNVISKSGVIMRVGGSKAVHMVNSGEFKFTNKGKLRSFLNKERKLHNNMRTIKGLGITTKEQLDKHIKNDGVYYHAKADGSKQIVDSTTLYVMIPNINKDGYNRGIMPIKPFKEGQRLIVAF